MKKIVNVLLFYNLFIVCCLIVVGLTNKNLSANLFFVLLFIPVVLYFVLSAFKKTPVIKHIFSKKSYYMAHKILGVYSFIFVNLLFVALVKNVTSLLEILFIGFLLPLEAYFVLLILNKIIKPKNNLAEIIEEKIEEIKEIDKNALNKNTKEERELVGELSEVKEKDKRQFIKLIAGAGAGVMITMLINPSKAGAAFFGSVPGPGTIAIKDTTGTKIDPAIKSPTDGYGIMNTDEASYPYYYGFVNKDGAWYIVKSASDGSFTYSKGSSSYPWSSRASQTYASYDTTF